MQFETIRAAAVAVKNAILRGFNDQTVFFNRSRDEIFVGNVISGEPPFESEEIANVAEFLEETKTFCDNMPYCPPALEYLREFAADETPEFLVDLLRDLLEEAGGVVEDFKKMIDFVIRRFPPSSNNMYLNGRGGHRRVPTRELKLFKEFVGLEWGLTQQRAIPPFVKRVRVVLTFCPPSRRCYDVDNRVKPTLDALTEAGVWLDDKIVDQVDARKGDPVIGGAVVVEAFALDPQQRPILPPSLTPLPELKKSRKNNKKEIAK